MIEFHSPLAFGLLLIVAAVFLFRTRIRRAGLRFSWLGVFDRIPQSLRSRLMPLPAVLRALCLALLVVAAAGPREGVSISNISIDGVAMELVVDRSGSMNEKMIYKGEELSRFEAVKLVLEDFITSRTDGLEAGSGDLLGLVTFARYPDTVCPLVRNHSILVEFLKQTNTVRLRSEDGTAIGEAIALAAARLHSAEQEINKANAEQSGTDSHTPPEFTIKSKAIVLLTDGINNQGQISPQEAAEMAADWGIKIYAIGIGSGSVRVMDQFTIPGAAQLDETLLNSIAQETGGFYARADDAEQLKAVYERIGELEKSEIKSLEYNDYNEKFLPWAAAALAVLLAEIILSNTVLRKSP
ncbi:VWFA-related Acidobacterial domain protein [Limihaloglobus sulfuriphilus]|uniref:VWFA-related Acidobacterial domain protein n=1 Tax=Limihaloglobus sulfuriphilus TaxID=1851148 RepID=A0A1Q2MHQ5_9BACT|nr:VWA domain-containing protein [Limihaloglobus sulfuriphilus]AQQ72179.1 VWFA-related Acidobacterial domain protein [Limihaloglobus sulfuriphilus]